MGRRNGISHAHYEFVTDVRIPQRHKIKRWVKCFASAILFPPSPLFSLGRATRGGGGTDCLDGGIDAADARRVGGLNGEAVGIDALIEGGRP